MNSLFLQLSNEPSLYDAPLTYLILAITVYTSYRYMENSDEKRQMLFNTFCRSVLPPTCDRSSGTDSLMKPPLLIRFRLVSSQVRGGEAIASHSRPKDLILPGRLRQPAHRLDLAPRLPRTRRAARAFGARRC